MVAGKGQDWTWWPMTVVLNLLAQQVRWVRQGWSTSQIVHAGPGMWCMGRPGVWGQEEWHGAIPGSPKVAKTVWGQIWMFRSEGMHFGVQSCHMVLNLACRGTLSGLWVSPWVWEFGSRGVATTRQLQNFWTYAETCGTDDLALWAGSDLWARVWASWPRRSLSGLFLCFFLNSDRFHSSSSGMLMGRMIWYVHILWNDDPTIKNSLTDKNVQYIQ